MVRPVMMFLASQPIVHTTGVNWQLVLVICTSVCSILGCIFAVTSRYISSRITTAIDTLRIEVISVLDKRLSALETKTEGDSRRRDEEHDRHGPSGNRHPHWEYDF